MPSPRNCSIPGKVSGVRRLLASWICRRSLLPELVDPGTVVGEVLGPVREAVGLKSGVVIAPCTHDTGSAVAAVPAQGDDWAFLSCGTWSVVGDAESGRGDHAAGLCRGRVQRADDSKPHLVPQHYRSCGCFSRRGRHGCGRANRILTTKSSSWPRRRRKTGRSSMWTRHDSTRRQDMLVAIQQYCAETGQAVPQPSGRNGPVHHGKPGVCLPPVAG
jgi:hypothetical protein